jgi:hypothetical protein
MDDQQKREVELLLRGFELGTADEHYKRLNRAINQILWLAPQALVGGIFVGTISNPDSFGFYLGAVVSALAAIGFVLALCMKWR